MTEPPVSDPDGVVSFPITGMTCGGCVSSLSRVLERTPGVAVERVEVGSAAVRLSPPASASDVRAAVERAGFGIGASS